MKRCISFSFFTGLLLVLLSGCSSGLNERLLVRAIGVDQIASDWQITVLAECFDENQKEESYTANGETVAAALEQIEKQTGKTMLYSHSEMIIFGRTCAEQGLKSCLDYFIRHYDSRPNMRVYISDTTANEILTVENAELNVKEVNLSPLLNADKTGTAVSATLVSIINGTFGANHSAGIPIVRKNDALEICGNGLFYETVLACELNAEETDGALILSDKHAHEIAFDTDKCGKVSVSTRECNSTVQFTGSENRPEFTVDICLKGEISSLEKSLRPLPSDVLTEIEQIYAKEALSRVTQYLQTAVIEHGTDITGLGHAILHEDPACFETLKPTFAEYLQSAEFSVKVNATIERIEEEDVPYF